MPKSIIGIVSSNKGNKTIVVSVHTRKTHPIYKKQYFVTKKIVAHDEDNTANVGDKVLIVETRPLSATKRFKLSNILEKPDIREDDMKVIEQEEVIEEIKE